MPGGTATEEKSADSTIQTSVLNLESSAANHQTRRAAMGNAMHSIQMPAEAPSRIEPAPSTIADSSTLKAQRGSPLTKTRTSPQTRTGERQVSQPPKGTDPNHRITEIKGQKTGRPTRTRKIRNPKTTIPMQTVPKQYKSTKKTIGN